MSQRNTTVDVVRGFAMLLVVLGHTMSGVTSDFENSLLFQMIWTLQMPLFIIISGYVTRYSRPLTTAGELWGFVKKRSLAYLLPWCVWTFVVRGLIVGQTSFFNPGYLLWTMDAGYWFLISIWTINMIFGVADYFRNKLKQRCFDCAQHDIKESLVGNVAVQLMFCALGMVILAGVGLWLGLSFFCIKLTLYYLPIYLLGYVYGQLQERLMAVRWSSVAVNWTIVLALGIWLTCISRFDFYSGADSAVMILCRFVVSILGCVAVIGLFTASCKSGGYCAYAENILWKYISATTCFCRSSHSCPSWRNRC